MAKAVADIRALARTHTRMAINVLAAIARQKTAPPAARVTASVALLDRGWGKADTVLVNGDIKLTIRKMIDGDDAIDITPIETIEKKNSEDESE